MKVIFWSFVYVALLSALVVAPAAASPQAPDRPQGVGGSVLDRETQRPLPGATVEALLGGVLVATATVDSEGAYRLHGLDAALYTILAEIDGFQTAAQTEVRVSRGKVTVIEFELTRARAITEEVVVTAKASADDPRTPVTSFALSREEIRRSPGTAGDILRAMDTLPGATATGEFSSFQVRGRGPRDNLILVDGIPFDKVTHFDQTIGEGEEVNGGGRFSIFAPNLIEEAEFFPGGFRVPFGGKNGSLLKLNVAEGNNVTPVVSGRVEVTGWELNYDGPTFVTDNTSALVSARGQYFGPLLDWVGNGSIGSPTLYDVIGKTTSDLGSRDKLSVIGILAPEMFERNIDNVVAGLESTEEDAENSVLVANSKQDSILFGGTWQHLMGETAFLSNTFYYRYSDKLSRQGEALPELATGPEPADIPIREDILVIGEGEREWGWRGDYNVQLGTGSTMAFGGRLTHLDLDYDITLDGPWVRYVYDQNDTRPPGQDFVLLLPEFVDNTYQAAAWRPAAYGEYSFNVGRRLTLTPGLRYDHDGFNDQSLWSPRLNASLAVGSRTRLSAGGGVFYQSPRFIQLAANEANEGLGNEQSTQLVAGMSHYLRPDMRFSAEGYYQWLDDLVVIPDQTTSLGTNAGGGRSYGLDMMLVKRITNRWYGQANYSYAVAERDDNLGEGIYWADFNRPHVFSVFVAYQFTASLQVGGKWKLMSGRPTDEFIVNEDVFNDPGFLRFSKEFTTHNTLRFPRYHTLNVRVDYRLGLGRVGLVLFLDFLNVYGHKNVNSFSFDERTGANVPEGLETFPTFGIKFEF